MQQVRVSCARVYKQISHVSAMTYGPIGTCSFNAGRGTGQTLLWYRRLKSCFKRTVYEMDETEHVFFKTTGTDGIEICRVFLGLFYHFYQLEGVNFFETHTVYHKSVPIINVMKSKEDFILDRL